MPQDKGAERNLNKRVIMHKYEQGCRNPTCLHTQNTKQGCKIQSTQQAWLVDYWRQHHTWSLKHVARTFDTHSANSRALGIVADKNAKRALLGASTMLSSQTTPRSCVRVHTHTHVHTRTWCNTCISRGGLYCIALPPTPHHTPECDYTHILYQSCKALQLLSALALY